MPTCKSWCEVVSHGKLCVAKRFNRDNVEQLDSHGLTPLQAVLTDAVLAEVQGDVSAVHGEASLYTEF